MRSDAPRHTGGEPEAFDVLYERTGAQARTQVEALQHALPLRRVHLVGRSAARTQERGAAFEATLGLEVLALSSITEGLRGAPPGRHAPPVVTPPGRHASRSSRPPCA